MELSIGCIRRIRGAFANRTRKVNFSIQSIVDFALNFLVHAFELDHYAAQLIFRPNLLKQVKNEGFFQQQELRKTDTTREVCVGMVAKIDVCIADLFSCQIFFLERKKKEAADSMTSSASIICSTDTS